MDEKQQRANDLIAQANDLQAAGKKLEAAPMYVEAAQLFAPYASFALPAGDSYVAAGDDEAAAQAYRIVLSMVPDHDEAEAGLRGAERRLREAQSGATVPNESPISESRGFFRRRKK